MKILFDFLPIALFFGMFKYAEGRKDWAAATATEWLGFMVAGGIVGQTEAPVLLATVVVIFATFAQITWLRLRGQKLQLKRPALHLAPIPAFPRRGTESRPFEPNQHPFSRGECSG